MNKFLFFLFISLTLPMISPAQNVNITAEEANKKGNEYYNKKDYTEAVKWYRLAAEQGYAQGQRNLGVMYFKGYGITKDYTEAAKWYRKAAEQGHAQGQCELGNMYYNGDGVTKDYTEAVKWYRKAAERGYAQGQRNLGVMYKNGDGVTKDYTEAAKWYRKAAEQGHAQAQCSLAIMYYNGDGVTKDYTEAVKWYRKAAEQGDAQGQYSLGNMYYNGHGVTKDYTEAVKWYRKAAEQGDAQGQCNLGVMYKNGDGVIKDYTEAAKWYRKAAEQGHTKAMNYFGNLYENGQGVQQNYQTAKEWYQKALNKDPNFTLAKNNLASVEKKIAEQTGNSNNYDITAEEANKKGDEYYDKKNYSEAVKWYRKAAEQGYAAGQDNLGYMYSNGYGVPQDKAEAVKWYRKAAEQGRANAQFNLGYMYSNGHGVPQDKAEAFKWYRKAAEQGDAKAMNSMGVLYENGQAVTKNYQTAKEWYQKALNKDPNYTKAKENLANVEKKIAEQSSNNNNYAQNSKPATKSNETPRQQTVSTTIMMPDVDKDIPLTSVKNPNILAVIIGNEKYSKLPDVPYAENDAKMFKEYCEKTLGVTEKHIRYLPNAGYVDIRGAMNWLKTGTSSLSGDASVIFYYAGHGLPDPNTRAQYILPVDVDGKDLDLTISLQKLYDDMGQMPAKSVTVFLDACFSGTNRDNNMVAANSGARLALTKSKIGTPKGKTVIFSATEDDQTAHPFKDRKHGFFTYFLLRKLQESRGTATLGEIADYVTKSVKRAVFDEIQVSQTPSVKPSGNFANDWRHMKLK